MKEKKLLNICDKFLKSIPSNLNYITPSELKFLLETNPDSVFILDNRTQEAFENYHIPNSTNIFFREILDKKNLVKLPKDKKIIVCCWVGHTASQILAILQILGYDAIGLKYGMGLSAIEGEDQRGWKELNYPLNSIK